jgi:hypothetical protein
MSEETVMDKTLREFLESVTKVLEQHKLALERLHQNQQIEHVDVAAIGAQVNEHRQILVALDTAVRQRMGEPPVEPPREPVN